MLAAWLLVVPLSGCVALVRACIVGRLVRLCLRKCFQWLAALVHTFYLPNIHQSLIATGHGTGGPANQLDL
jgi:hypothetical protein